MQQNENTPVAGTQENVATPDGGAGLDTGTTASQRTRRALPLPTLLRQGLRGFRPPTTSPRSDNAGTPDEMVSLDSPDMVVVSPQLNDYLLNLVRWGRRLIIPLAILAWSGVVLLLLWAAGHVTKSLLLIIVAGLLAYALAPLVTLLHRFMPRFLAIVLVYLLVLAGVGGLLYLIARTAVEQITSLSSYLGFLLQPGPSAHPNALEQTLRSLGITTDQLAAIRARIISTAEGLSGDIVPLLTSVADSALNIILVTVLSIYLLIDGSRTARWLRQNMPYRQRGRVRFLLETLQRVVGGYIRGQLILCSLIGILVGLGMWLLGVPYALLLGVLAFVLEFIPILGTLVSGAVCVLLALTKGWLLALLVLGYFIGVHIIEGDVVGPRIVGKAVGLHPVVSIIALIAGGELFGIWGALLASPVAGIIQAVLTAIWAEWREMHPQAFQKAKEQVAAKVDQHVADKPVTPAASEPEAKLLSVPDSEPEADGPSGSEPEARLLSDPE